MMARITRAGLGEGEGETKGEGRHTRQREREVRRHTSQRKRGKTTYLAERGSMGSGPTRVKPAARRKAPMAITNWGDGVMGGKLL